ncbi:MAG: M50 family metallopeptidase [Acidobacteriaceae bacterium]
MRAVRNFLCWMFALGAVVFLRSSLFSLLDIASWPDAHLPPTMLSAGIRAALPVLGVVYGLACWTFWTGKTSARGWGLAASGVNAILGCLFLYMDRRFLTAPATAFLNPDALLLGFGIAGIIAFRRRDVVKAERWMQPLPGDGTNAIVNRAIWVAGTGAFIAGMNWWWRWAQANHLVGIRRSVLNNLALLLALELLMVVIHEFGHAAAGVALGMKLRAFVVGPLQWRVRDGKWEFRFILSGFLAMGGATAVAPTDPNRPLWRDICMVAAGPAISLATGFVALWATLTAPGHPWVQDWLLPLAFFTTLSLLAAVVNLIPFRTKAFYSDGARIFQLLSRGPWADLHRAFSAAAASTITPLRPRDYDIDAIERAGSSISVGQPALHLRLLAASYYLDRGCIADATQALADAEAVYLESASDISAEMHTPFIFGKAYLQHDADGARLWWERMQARKPLRNADYWIARSAFLWSQHRLDEAREAWEKGNALAQQLPNAGAYETDRDCFALLHKELQVPVGAG